MKIPLIQVYVCEDFRCEQLIWRFGASSSIRIWLLVGVKKKKKACTRSTPGPPRKSVGRLHLKELQPCIENLSKSVSRSLR